MRSIPLAEGPQPRSRRSRVADRRPGGSRRGERRSTSKGRMEAHGRIGRARNGNDSGRYGLIGGAKPRSWLLRGERTADRDGRASGPPGGAAFTRDPSAVAASRRRPRWTALRRVQRRDLRVATPLSGGQRFASDDPVAPVTGGRTGDDSPVPKRRPPRRRRTRGRDARRRGGPRHAAGPELRRVESAGTCSCRPGRRCRKVALDGCASGCTFERRRESSTVSRTRAETARGQRPR